MKSYLLLLLLLATSAEARLKGKQQAHDVENVEEPFDEWVEDSSQERELQYWSKGFYDYGLNGKGLIGKGLIGKGVVGKGIISKGYYIGKGTEKAPTTPPVSSAPVTPTDAPVTMAPVEPTPTDKGVIIGKGISIGKGYFSSSFFYGKGSSIGGKGLSIGNGYGGKGYMVGKGVVIGKGFYGFRRQLDEA